MSKNRKLLITDIPDYKPHGFHEHFMLTDIQNDVKKRNWWLVEVHLQDASSLQGLIALGTRIGATTRLRFRINHKVDIGILHSPTQFVDGRTVIESHFTTSDAMTELFVRLGWYADLASFLAVCVGPGMKAMVGDATRIGITKDIPFKYLGSASLATIVSDTELEPDRDNPGPQPSVDKLFLPAEGYDRSDLSDSISRDFLPVERQVHTWSQSSNYSQSAISLALGADERIYNPIGWTRSFTENKAFVAPRAANSLSFMNESAENLHQSLDGDLPIGAIGKLRKFGAIIDVANAHVSPIARARFLVQCAAAGLPVVTSIDRLTQRILEQAGVCVPFLSDENEILVDNEKREAYCIYLARWAHSNFVFGSGSPLSKQLPDVSVLMATKRPEFISHAVDQYRIQRIENKELLLGMHGFTESDLDPGTRQKLKDESIRVFPFRQDVIFGDLLRELSIRADGEIVSKMDDDDWYGQNHLLDLVLALNYSGAELVGSGVQYTYLHNAAMTIRRKYDHAFKYGGHPGGPTFTLTKSTLKSVGNWPRVSRAVDTGLNRAILRYGGSVFQSHSINFLFNKRSSGHTWNATNEYFLEKMGESWKGFRPPLGIAEVGPQGMIPEDDNPGNLGEMIPFLTKGADPFFKQDSYAGEDSVSRGRLHARW